jgi:hypothetical protein
MVLAGVNVGLRDNAIVNLFAATADAGAAETLKLASFSS